VRRLVPLPKLSLPADSLRLVSKVLVAVKFHGSRRTVLRRHSERWAAHSIPCVSLPGCSQISSKFGMVCSRYEYRSTVGLLSYGRQLLLRVHKTGSSQGEASPALFLHTGPVQCKNLAKSVTKNVF
jgi:hypothetical protein